MELKNNMTPEEETNAIMEEIPLLDKDDYYKDTEFISCSHIKLFDKCEKLYYDTYVSKVYEEGDKDYFTYGKLVDAFLSESTEFVKENFVLVERKINVEDTLKYENEIQSLKNYLAAPEFLEKIAKGNKVAQKGLEKRTKEIADLEEKLEVIKSLGSKIQVTTALWREAEETALAIKTHPSFVYLEWNNLTSQQMLIETINGIPRKGRLDHLKLSPAMTKIYAIYKANKITKDEMRAQIKELNHNDWWAIVTDLKTCYDLVKLEPFNDLNYRGQVAFYRDLVANFFGIPHLNVKGRLLVGDKATNRFKMSELFEYPQEALDEKMPWIEETCKRLYDAKKSGIFISEKEKHGLNQHCFKCSECRFCPFSNKPGEPVMISAPRFEKGNTLGSVVPFIVQSMEELVDQATGDY